MKSRKDYVCTFEQAKKLRELEAPIPYHPLFWWDTVSSVVEILTIEELSARGHLGTVLTMEGNMLRAPTQQQYPAYIAQELAPLLIDNGIYAISLHKCTAVEMADLLIEQLKKRAHTA